MLQILDKAQAIARGHEQQAAPDTTEIDAMVSGIAGVQGVISGCDATVSGVDMTVTVASGQAVVPGAASENFAGGSVTVATNPGSAGYERTDYICLKASSGVPVLDYLVGVPGNPPIPPLVPAGDVLLHRVDVRNGAAVIVADDVLDKRIFLPASAGFGLSPPTVKVAATGNVSRSGTPTIDGQATAVGDDVLLPAQTIPAEDGPWRVGSPWVRPPWFPSGSVARNVQVFVRQGTYADTLWELTNGPVTVDTDAETWSRMNYVDTTTAQTVGGAKTFSSLFTALGGVTVGGVSTFRTTGALTQLLVNPDTGQEGHLTFQEAGTSQWSFKKAQGDAKLYLRDRVNGREQLILTAGGSAAAALTEIASRVQIDDQLDMQSHKVVNVTDPVNPQDAATRAWVLALVGALPEIDIVGLIADLASKVAKAGDTMTGTLNLNASPPIKLPSGTAGQVLKSDASGNLTLGTDAGAPATGTLTGDGTTTAFTVTHNLGKASPYAMIAEFYFRTGTDQETRPSISARGANSFTATWSVAPANGTLIDWMVI